MILTAIVVLTATFTGSTCAAIDNRTNTAVWAEHHPFGLSYAQTHYKDYGDNLGYANPIPRSVWPALRRVENYMDSTPAGPKIRVECVKVKQADYYR